MQFAILCVVGALAVAIGIAVGKMPCWSNWQGYSGLVIVTPLAIHLGLPPAEVLFDCLLLGLGFRLARTPNP